MTVILDLDYTLLDTAKLKRALENDLKQHGVTSEHFRSTYRRHPLTDTPEHYQIDRHAALLEEIHGYPRETILAQLDITMRRLPSFLYDDAIPFLQFLKSLTVTAAMLTLGNPKFQERKVRDAGIAKFFDYVNFTDTKKHELTLPYTDPKTEWIFINDKAEELRDLRTSFPDSFLIQIRRSPEIVPASDDPSIQTFSNLENIQAVISQRLQQTK